MEKKFIGGFLKELQEEVPPSSITLRTDLQKRKEEIQVLKRVVINLHLLLLKTFSYHKVLDTEIYHDLYVVTGKQYAEMSKSINEISGRIRALQFNVPVSNNRFLKVAERNALNYEELVNIDLEDLVIGNEIFIEKLKDAVELISVLKDKITASILKKIIDKHEDYIIMLKEKSIYKY